MPCCPHRQHFNREIRRAPHTIGADVETIGGDEHQVWLHDERALTIEDDIDRGLHDAPELIAADVLVDPHERAAEYDLMAKARRGRLAYDAEIEFHRPVRLLARQIFPQRQTAARLVFHDDDGPIVWAGSQAACATAGPACASALACKRRSLHASIGLST
jgi:hypothetical protein